MMKAGNENPRVAGMSLVDGVRKLILAHLRGDSETFLAAVKQIIEREKRRSNHVLAEELERLISDGRTTTVRALTPLPNVSSEVPRDRERGAILLESRPAVRSLEDVLTKNETLRTLERIVIENRQRDKIASFGLRPIRKILFYGPPGCGKTLSAEAIAKELYLPFNVVRFDAVISSYLGETAANLRKVFDFARTHPSVFLFDEFDAIGKKRTDVEEHGELKRVVNAFLQMLDGFEGEALIIAATNHEQLLDYALWRRFDEILQFPPPTTEQIIDLLQRHLRQFGVSGPTLIPATGRALRGASHADVERIAIEAIKWAILQGEQKVTRSAIEGSVQSYRNRAALRQRMAPSRNHK